MLTNSTPAIIYTSYKICMFLFNSKKLIKSAYTTVVC